MTGARQKPRWIVGRAKARSAVPTLTSDGERARTSPRFAHPTGDYASRNPALALAFAMTAATAVALSPPTRAADYPERDIRVVVPFAAAGTTDIVTRILFEEISRSLGRAVIVDNRPGAGGNIGVEQVAKSPPDGYTLVVADPTTSLAANVTLFPNLKFNPVRDFTPAGGFGFTGAAVIVTNSLAAHTLQEFATLAKRKPRELLYGSTGNGSPGHLSGELLSRLLGIETVHVPYRNGAQGTTDLLTGRIHFWVAPIPTRLEQIRAGQLRVLAVAGNERARELPDVPTVAELGFGAFDASTTYAVFAPRGVSAAIVRQLYAEIARALEHGEVRDKFRAAGVEPKLATLAEVTALLEAEIDQWARIIEAAHIQARE
jgi:tripartite-type tricarboxylate transporter receptor subunit TctC